MSSVASERIQTCGTWQATEVNRIEERPSETVSADPTKTSPLISILKVLSYHLLYFPP